MAAKSKLSAEEQEFLTAEPEPTPLDEAEASEDETAAKPEPDIKAEPAKADGKAPAADDKGKAEAEKPKQSMVPHGAMEAERQKRKAVEQELARERTARAERDARLDERMRILNDALALKQQQPAVPNPDDDIFGYARHLETEINQLKGMTAQERQQAQQRQQAEVQNRQLMAAYMADAQSFAAETPDFMEAYRHLLASRDQELAAMGYNPMQRQEYIRNDEMNIAQSALAQGRSAAETIYNLAKLRNFQGKAPAQQQEQPAPEQPKQPDGSAEIKRLSDAQSAATSLSNAGGSPGGGKITLETLDRMSKDEFKAFVSKLNRKDPYGYDKFVEKLSVS